MSAYNGLFKRYPNSKLLIALVMKSTLPILFSFAFFLTGQAHAFSFVDGHAYSTSENAINQYTESGAFVSSLSLPEFGFGLRGLAFGPDRNLYVVREANTEAFVDVIRDDGSTIKTYTFTGDLTGSASFGNIVFDSSGQNFYVGAVDGLYKFETSGNTGTLFVNQLSFDIDVTKNNDLIIASGNDISRYSNDGLLISVISNLADPNKIASDTSPRLVDARGVIYDEKSDKTFVTMLGYSGFNIDMVSKIIELKGFTNEISGIEYFRYGDDLFITDTGNLLIGSRTESPGMFTTDLQYIGMLQGPAAKFVTALPVPEPNSYSIFLIGLGLIGLMRVYRP